MAKLSDKPCIVYEGGEALRLDGFSIGRGVNGIRRTLAHLAMMEPISSGQRVSSHIMDQSFQGKVICMVQKFRCANSKRRTPGDHR